MNWIIQDSNNEHSNWVRIYNAALLLGDSVRNIDINMSHEINCISEKTVSIGGEDFIDKCMDNPWLRCGIFRDNAFFNMRSYREMFGKDFLNSDSLDIEFKYLERLGSQNLFFRPFDDKKSFDGAVFDLVEFVDLFKDIIPPSEIVTISSVKEIYCEWRFVVVEYKIVSFCCYRGEEKKFEAPITFVNHIITSIMSFRNAPSAFVMDICKVRDGYRVVECNVFNSSNFYECDFCSIVYEIDRLMIKEN